MTPGQDPRQVAADLQAKQDMSVALREATEDMLRKLRDLCAALCSVTPPATKPVLQKEVIHKIKKIKIAIFNTFSIIGDRN